MLTQCPQPLVLPIWGNWGTLVGAAFGFILGPAIGGFAARISLQTPVFLAVGITVLNMLFGIFVLPESLQPGHRAPRVRVRDLNPFTQLAKVFQIPRIRWLLVVGFCYYLPFSILLATSGTPTPAPPQTEAASTK